MRSRLRLLGMLVVTLVALHSCTGLKKVPKDEVLYTGAKVQLVVNGDVGKKGSIKSNAKSAIKTKANNKLLWARPGLWLYYAMGEPKRPKSVRSWIKNKLGQPPVYMSGIDIPLTARGIEAKMYNTGYLDAYAEYEIKQDKKGKTASVLYTVHVYPPFKIKSIDFPNDSTEIEKAIARTYKKSKIDTGDVYSLETLIEERARIENVLKRRGYYYFNQDHILFAMDTNNTERTVRLNMTLKRTMPEKSKIVYRFGEINVYPDYRLGADTAEVRKLVRDSINYYRADKSYIRLRPIINSIYIKPNHIYDRRMHQVTLSRLNGLGVFKFINMELQPQDTTLNGLLGVNIYLTPLPRKSASFDVQLATKSNNFIGPGITLQLRNRNAFRGAELMIYNLRGSFETQFSGVYKGQFTYEINPRIELQVPRIIAPFKIKRSNMFVPRTRFGVEYSYLSRVGYFDMNSAKFEVGYKWKDAITIDHNLNLLNVNYYNIYNRSDQFNELVNGNTLLRRRFEEQFILGMGYSFFYNEQLRPRQRRNTFYVNVNAEIAGNMLAGISQAITKRKVDANNPSKILDVNFAQYARMDIDIRDYFKTSENTMLALRFIAGWAKPYGNSLTMPYAKQFFAGGAYSLRGFPANAVGPGTYAPPDSINNIFYLQQGGEIKFEANAEFRFPIVKFLKGAVFVDAGNVWLNKPNPEVPNGEIKWNRLFQDLALSSGAGVRLDLDFFVLRLDIGIPLRNPSLGDANKWIIRDLKFKNVMFNLAFGYPF